MRRLFKLLLLLLPALMLAVYGRARAATLIVPDNYPTIQAAINAAQPGDTVLVRAGTYFENLILNKAIRLTAETYNVNDPTQNTSIIDGGSAAYVILIPSGVTPMPTIRGFVIRHGNDGIQSLAEHVVEYNYLLLNSGDLNDYGSGSGGINHHNVYFAAGDDAIDLDNLNRPLTIEHNRLLYSLDDGIETRLQDGTAPAQPITITIRYNEIIGSDEDGLQFIDYNQANDTQRRFVVTRNLIARSRFAGIGLMPNANSTENYSGADIVEAIRVYNNTFYSNTYGISGGDNLVAFNNLVISSTVRGVWRVQGQNGDNSVVAYTLFQGNGTNAQQSILGPGNLFGLSPLFVAPPNPGPDAVWGTVDDDFSGLVLLAGSPAIDVGTTQYVAVDGETIPPTPISDYAGLAPDLGWKEFIPPVPATATPSPTATTTETLSPTSTPPATLTKTATPTGTLLTLTPIPDLTQRLYLPLVVR